MKSCLCCSVFLSSLFIVDLFWSFSPEVLPALLNVLLVGTGFVVFCLETVTKTSNRPIKGDGGGGGQIMVEKRVGPLLWIMIPKLYLCLTGATFICWGRTRSYWESWRTWTHGSGEKIWNVNHLVKYTAFPSPTFWSFHSGFTYLLILIPSTF